MRMHGVLTHLSDLVLALAEPPGVRRLRRVRTIRALAFCVAVAFIAPGTPAFPESGPSAATTPAAIAPAETKHRSAEIRRTPIGRTTSVTTGWRKIAGWEREIIRKNPNLEHWAWIPMNEMGKAYKRLPPGQVAAAGQAAAPPRYVKPKHIPIIVGQKPLKTAVVDSPSGPKYIKPKHLAVDQGRRGNYIKPTHVPTPIGVPTTAVRWAVPKTAVRMAVPQTAVSLASTKTSVRMAEPTTALKSDEPASAPDSDAFAQPDPYEHSAYGLCRKNRSDAAVKTRLSARLVHPKPSHARSR